ncbi:MAG: protein jag [Anaeromicrobium sp.]|jgi:spoIIIJ-associated protein|uniref:RNA-binding cell elongation regulator Jag/EloR n=1 Tax=Anaeromicrobium sp. TaxID=1929132 RepID=UPI0025F2865D|nr:RNA-binding cell elongation regulator Jag/EloR [Anaeromicrobium sp.]MCT4594661.1 protein jag [Anaeromicrobium sp.]
MKFTEKTGKTVEEAVKNALEELNVGREEVDIEVLEVPSRGIFGLIGTRPAKIKVTVIDNPERKATEFLEDMLQKMNIVAKYKTKLENNTLNLEIIGSNMGVLIGKRGQTLDAIQYLVSLVVNKERDEYIRVVLDTENYRRKRRQTLIKLANKLAYKAKSTSRDVVLEPMNPYERRIIHAALQNHPHVVTKSKGEEPFRKVVIEVK